MRVLVVEDDPAMASVLRRGMAENGFAVDVARTGEDGLWLATEQKYDAIVLDLMLPGMDGMAMLRKLRDAKRWAPVLVLTARSAVGDRVSALDVGADDYLIKPFEFSELLARLRALIRRGSPERPTVLTVGDLTLDPASRKVARAGTPIPMTRTEFALLQALMRRPDQVLSRSELIEEVWDFAFDSDSNVVDVYVGYLRGKVDRPFGRRSLQTVRGTGYRLSADDERAGITGALAPRSGTSDR